MDDQGTNREGGGGVAPRFSLRRYLSAFTLVSIGIAAVSIGRHIWATRPEPVPGFSPLPPSVALIWIVASVGIVAGLFAPFKRELLGALLGFAVGFFCAAAAFVVSMWEAWMGI